MGVTLETAKRELAASQDPERASDIVRFFIGRHSARGALPQSAALLRDYLQRFPDTRQTAATVLALAEGYEGIDDEVGWDIMTRAIRSSARVRQDPDLLIEYALAANVRGETDVAMTSLASAFLKDLTSEQKARAYLARALANRDEHEMEKAQADLEQARIYGLKSGRSKDVLEIVETLRSPGHSLDPKTEHKEEAPKPVHSFSAPAFAFSSATTAAMGLGAVLYLRRRRR